ncbi:hypothetical protein R5R35_004462 [Gryllus longicercus]|uniref:Protein LTV1 homolog n=1 Tax=Gryllus longicercus TaxID=2509291 RepID=A0AAN9VDQ5_9ORTH
MPKTKKKFIDKKHAVTFHLVHRSQQDPLVADESAPQHVLVPANSEKGEKVNVKKIKEEQQKYGIFFDDDYNYLQHLRSIKEVVGDLQPSPRPRQKDDFPPLKGQSSSAEPLVKIQLPSSVFASAVEEDIGMLNKAAPRSGLRLDLDPDVVAAMDDDFDFDNPDNELEDNFIELANAEKSSDDESLSADSASEENYDDEIDDDVPSLQSSECAFDEEETKSRFTNYSMSSSVIRRNEQLTLLDDRFEQLFAEYDDNEIGALDSEEIEGHLTQNSDLLEQCIEDFEKRNATHKHEVDKTLKIIENQYTDSEDETELLEVPDKTEKWDCESILSTYSNLYNHPKLISEPKGPQRIRVSERTGMPLDVLDGGSNKLTAKSLAKLDSVNQEMDQHCRAESILSTLSALSIRSKNETPEEKRNRKKAVKEYRQARRMERKLNTEAFKEEKKRQEKILLNNRCNLQGVKII